MPIEMPVRTTASREQVCVCVCVHGGSVGGKIASTDVAVAVAGGGAAAATGKIAIA